MRKLARRAVLAAAFLLFAPPGEGQEGVLRIAAVVNNEVISIFDLTQRIRMALFSSNLPDTPDQQRRVAPRVLRQLIDERLRFQEATRLNIRVSDRDLKQARQQIERNNNLPPDSLDDFLARNGIRPVTLDNQLQAGIAWQKLMRRRIVPTIQIGEEEIDTILQRIAANEGKTEFHVAEILLPVDDPDDQGEVMALANQLVAQLRRGASFGAVARQFSQSASAATGGDIGWVQDGELEDTLNAALPRMTVGELSDPISSPDGVRILFLIDRRDPTGAGQNDSEVALRQLLLTAEADAEPTDRESLLARAVEIRETVTGCEDFARLAEDLGSPQPPEPARARIGDLNDRLREVASSLEVGEASEPIMTPAGVQLIMICERVDAPDASVRDEVRETLVRQRLDMLSRRYLRDLRRAAFVDRRV
ncbi:MAG: peptidylprolyl isomerase [Alphaproteobacteria bacterium]